MSAECRYPHHDGCVDAEACILAVFQTNAEHFLKAVSPLSVLEKQLIALGNLFHIFGMDESKPFPDRNLSRGLVRKAQQSGTIAVETHGICGSLHLPEALQGNVPVFDQTGFVGALFGNGQVTDNAPGLPCLFPFGHQQMGMDKKCIKGMNDFLQGHVAVAKHLCSHAGKAGKVFLGNMRGVFVYGKSGTISKSQLFPGTPAQKNCG